MREKARFGVAMVAALAFVGTACSRNQSTRVSLPHRLLPRPRALIARRLS